MLEQYKVEGKLKIGHSEKLIYNIIYLPKTYRFLPALTFRPKGCRVLKVFIQYLSRSGWFSGLRFPSVELLSWLLCCLGSAPVCWVFAFVANLVCNLGWGVWLVTSLRVKNW